MWELAALYGKPIQGVCGATIHVSGGYDFISAMEPFGGTVHEIKNVAEGFYFLSGLVGYAFTDAMLDRVGG